MTYQPNYQYIPPLNKDWLTPVYDFFSALVGLGSGFKRRVLQAAQIRNGDQVADIGCGTGLFLALARQQYPNAKLAGLDPDARALAIARRRLSGQGPEVELIQAFAESLPWPASSLDVVVSSMVFHHLPDFSKQKAALEIFRVLKPGGRVLIADFGPAPSPWLIRLLYLFEQVEYLEGNFRGLIPLYLKAAGLEDIYTAGRHFPGIQLLGAAKPILA